MPTVFQLVDAMKPTHCAYCGWDGPIRQFPFIKTVIAGKTTYDNLYLHPACVKDMSERRREERKTA